MRFAWMLLLVGCLALPEGDLPEQGVVADGAAGDQRVADAAADAATDAHPTDATDQHLPDGQPGDVGPLGCESPLLDLTAVLPNGAPGSPQMADANGDGHADVLVPMPNAAEVRILVGHPCGLRHGRLIVVPTVHAAWAVLLAPMGNQPRTLVTLERDADERWFVELYLPDGDAWVHDPTSTVALPAFEVAHQPGEAPTLLAPINLNGPTSGGLVLGYFNELWTLPATRGPGLAEQLIELRRADGLFFQAVGLLGVPSPGGGGEALLVGEQTGFSLAANLGGGTHEAARTYERGYNLKNYATFQLDGDGLPDLIGSFLTAGGLARVYAPRAQEGALTIEELVLPEVAGLEPGPGPLVWALAAGSMAGPESVDLAVLAQSQERLEPRLYIATDLRYRAGDPTVALGRVASIDLRAPGFAVLVGEFDAQLPGQEVLLFTHNTNDILCFRWTANRVEYCPW